MHINTAPPIGGLIATEPRMIGNSHTLIYQFNIPVSPPATASVVSPGPANATVSAAVGNNITVMLAGVTDNQRIITSLTGVNGDMTGFLASVGFLVGDFNNTRAVTASDIAGAKTRIGQTTTESNFIFDVNASGTVDQADISDAKSRSCVAVVWVCKEPLGPAARVG